MNKINIPVEQGRGFIHFTSYVVYILTFYYFCYTTGGGTTFLWGPVVITAGWALFWAILFTLITE